ncbi:UNVERIFIED_CONTAM: hypothetical protein Slati_1459900, partial [Sesamum latifolium]
NKLFLILSTAGSLAVSRRSWVLGRRSRVTSSLLRIVVRWSRDYLASAGSRGRMTNVVAAGSLFVAGSLFAASSRGRMVARSQQVTV